MNKKEKVINGVLCWDNSDTWVPYTQEQLTLRLTTLGFAYRELEKDYEQISAIRRK
jgi:hypothetical protein